MKKLIKKTKCLIFGHKKTIPMLTEDEECIHTKGCPRCKKPSVSPFAWKKIPCPKFSTQIKWDKYIRKRNALIRLRVKQNQLRHYTNSRLIAL